LIRILFFSPTIWFKPVDHFYDDRLAAHTLRMYF
jgi:hypothetical protein